MNIKEAINYRNKCIICQSDMTLFVKDNSKSKIIFNDKGLIIRKPNNNSMICKLYYDNSFSKSIKNKEFLVKDHMYLVKVCLNCNNSKFIDYSEHNTIILKGRSVGYSGIAKAKYNKNIQMSFGPTGPAPLDQKNLSVKGKVWGGFKSGKYKKSTEVDHTSTYLSIDNAKLLSCMYIIKIEFYKDTYFTYIPTDIIRYHDAQEFWHVYTTSFADMEPHSKISNGKFFEPISKLNSLKVPSINMSKVDTIEKLIEKCKLYTLFS